MKKIMRISTIITLLGILAMLSACTNPMKTLHDADYNVTQNQEKIQRIQNNSTAPAPATVVKSGYYVNPVPIDPSQGPVWLNNKITLHAQNVSMNFLLSRILRDTDASVRYDNGANQNQSLSMDYSGSIKGALDEIASDTNYAYNIQNGVVDWSSFVTKTFNISFMPGTSSYQVGQDKGLNAGQAANTGASSSGSGNTIATVQGDLGSQQYSNLSGDLSVWNDLRTTLNELKSTDGTVAVSGSTTTVTVHDHPSNVQAMATYIDQLNRNMSREVAIQVQVLQVDLNKDFSYGVNWNTVFNVLGTKLGIFGNLGDAAASVTNLAAQGLTNNGIAKIQFGPSGGSNALIQALSQQGRVSVVTQPRVVTMNNQMAEIKITRDTAYLQSVSNTSVANAGNASNTSTLTPGIVTDGFSLYLLPKIQANKVYLQISSSLSTLTSISTVSNNGTVNQPVSTTSTTATTQSQPFQAIQVPTLANKLFNQRTVITSGATLMITGFQQITDQTQRSQFFGIKPLGSTGADRRNVQTIVLITPTVLGKY